MLNVEDQLTLLEDTLVSEFRCLQKMLEITQKESAVLLKGESAALAPILENKETTLDQVMMFEEERNKICKTLAGVFGVETEPLSVKALLPHFDQVTATRVRRLCDGIVALSEQQQDLNLKVNTLAQSWIEMIHSTQAYLLSFYQSPATYAPPGRQVPVQAPVWGGERRA